MRKYPDGHIEDVLDLSGANFGMGDMYRHPSGIIGFQVSSADVGFYWPNEGIISVRYPPVSSVMGIRSTVVFRDGDVGAAGDDYTLDGINGTCAIVSHNLGHTWDTLFYGLTGTPETPSSYVGQPYAWNKYLAYGTVDGFTFFDRFIKRRHTVAAHDRGEIATPDTLYGVHGCGLIRTVLDTSYYIQFDSDSICYKQGELDPPRNVQTSPVQLHDGRTHMYGETLQTLSSATVRPFRIMDIEVRCDTLRFRIRGENRAETKIGFSQNALMKLGGYIDETTSRVYTFVRWPNGKGRFELYADYGALHDTIYLADLRSWSDSRMHLKINGTEEAPILSCVEDSLVALIRWYRDGQRIEGIDYNEQAPFRYTATRSGRYHAHIMTQNWCETTTDTVDVVVTGIAGEVSQEVSPNASYAVLYDLLGRELERISVSQPEDLSGHAWRSSYGYLVFYDTQGVAVGRKRIVAGTLR